MTGSNSKFCKKGHAAMKQSKKVFACVAGMPLLLIILLVITGALTGSQGSGRRIKNMQSIVINSFEKGDQQWNAHFSQFYAKKWDENQNKFVIDSEKCAVTNFAGKPWGVRSETNTNQCLAVKGGFDRKGYNVIEVFPVKNGTNLSPIPMTGKVENIHVWVWGGNFKWRLEMHLEDYRGYRHRVDMGWLDYVGWRNLRVDVPDRIPQAEKYIPRTKNLSLVKFVLYAHPAERPDVFYVFFDRIKIHTDIYMPRFDGDELVRQGMKKNWMPSPKKTRKQ